MSLQVCPQHPHILIAISGFSLISLFGHLRLDKSLASHRCQPSRIRRDSPAFSSDVPRSREISRCPAFFENGIIFFPLPIRPYSTQYVCFATQQSDELRIKIGKDRLRIRTPTGH